MGTKQTTLFLPCSLFVIWARNHSWIHQDFLANGILTPPKKRNDSGEHVSSWDTSDASISFPSCAGLMSLCWQPHVVDSKIQLHSRKLTSWTLKMMGLAKEFPLNYGDFWCPHVGFPVLVTSWVVDKALRFARFSNIPNTIASLDFFYQIYPCHGTWNPTVKTKMHTLKWLPKKCLKKSSVNLHYVDGGCSPWNLSWWWPLGVGSKV